MIQIGKDVLQVAREKLTMLDIDDVRIADLSSLIRTASQCVDIGSQSMGQALGVERLLDKMDRSEN